MHERLAQQIAFLVEADKLKSVIRRTPLVDVSRLENSAEHSWHLVLAIMVLREYGPSDVELDESEEMVAVHDLVGLTPATCQRTSRCLGREVGARTGAPPTEFRFNSSRSTRALSNTVGRVRGA